MDVCVSQTSANLHVSGAKRRARLKETLTKNQKTTSNHNHKQMNKRIYKWRESRAMDENEINQLMKTSCRSFPSFSSRSLFFCFLLPFSPWRISDCAVVGLLSDYIHRRILRGRRKAPRTRIVKRTMTRRESRRRTARRVRRRRRRGRGRRG